MSKIDSELITNALKQQNPWWGDNHVLAEDSLKKKRDVYEKLWDKTVNNDLILAVTGLRRIGKTTVVKQIINGLIESGFERQRILYFSFEEANLARFSDLLEAIIETQIKKFPGQKLYFFFDEIQYVDLWNAILKKYFDLNLPLKFIVTGSSSLFLQTKAKESLAGRIIEVAMFPLGYGEYLRLIRGGAMPDQTSFWDYLCSGEFPYLDRLNSFEDKRQYVLDWVIGKIIESDLPKMKRVNNEEELITLVNVLISGSGQIVELQNLATDLGINRRTLAEYLRILDKAKIINEFFNRGVGFRTRSIRTRRVYCASTNAVVLKNTLGAGSESFDLKIGQIVENFVASYLARQSGEKFFWRQRQKEVDFVWETVDGLLPIEVKYQNKIRSEDLKNLIYFCKKSKITKAMVVTKNEERIENISGVEIKMVPAYSLF